MNIAMTGATGYIGKHLSNYLTEKGGHRIIPLGRAMFREGMSGLLVQTLTHCDVCEHPKGGLAVDEDMGVLPLQERYRNTSKSIASSR